MTLQEVIAALQRRWPNAEIGETLISGKYIDRASRIADYEMVNDMDYVGHGINGKEMWVYYSEQKKVICCGDENR